MLQSLKDAGINPGDLTYPAKVDKLGRGIVGHRLVYLQLTSTDQITISTGKAYCLTAAMVYLADNLLIYFSHEYHFHHIHGLTIGHSHSLDVVCFYIKSFEKGVNLRATTMHNYRVNANMFEQDNIQGKLLFQMLIHHGMSAIFDDHSLASEFLHVGK